MSNRYNSCSANIYRRTNRSMSNKPRQLICPNFPCISVSRIQWIFCLFNHILRSPFPSKFYNFSIGNKRKGSLPIIWILFC